jgi:hypothetical protein
MTTSKPEKTVNIEAMLISLIGIADNLATICTLGYYRPGWQFRMVMFVLHRKFDRNNQ